MKPINLKDAMKTLHTLEQAKRNNEFESNKDARWYSPERHETANKALEEAKHEYAEARAKLDEILDEVQKRAKVRTITSEEIVEALDRIETTLGISKKAMEGVQVHVDLNDQKFPNAYKWRPESTQFWAVYKGGSWRVLSIERDTCSQLATNCYITHTEASKAALLERMTRFSV